MYRLRLVFALPLFALSTLVLGLLSVIISIFSAVGARRMARYWAKTNLWGTGIRVRTEGAENIPASGGMVIAANHSSSADIGVVYGALPVDICWVAKSSLLKAPIIGWHLKRVHIPVERGKGGGVQRLMAAGAPRIRQGASVLIFPEGTRSQDPQQMLPFKRGGFLLAQAAGRPLLPVAILGTMDLWPPGAPLPIRSGQVTVRIGRPLDPNQFPADDPGLLTEATRAALEELLGQNQDRRAAA